MQLESYLHTHIPLSRHMGIGVVHADADQVRLSAPLTPNLNHQQTGFGGSISALAILAGWSLLWMRLREHSAGHQIVIQSNAVEYLNPAVTDFTAVCHAPRDAQWDRFLRTYRLRGRGRLELAAEVEGGGLPLATFSGKYVALRELPVPAEELASR
jgi:thioesterase domain-containing protein